MNLKAFPYLFSFGELDSLVIFRSYTTSIYLASAAYINGVQPSSSLESISTPPGVIRSYIVLKAISLRYYYTCTSLLYYPLVPYRLTLIKASRITSRKAITTKSSYPPPTLFNNIILLINKELSETIY
jgi:hypothetical protein